MLYPRIIPSLLVKNKGLVKTVKFDNPKYVGDPINAVRIFNEKTVDELIVLDIDATTNNREPDYKMIANLAAECRMPLCYGGGIKTTKQALKIFGLGVEKIALSSAVINNPKLITEVARSVGNQSVIVVLDDIKKHMFGKYYIYTHNGTKKINIDIFDYLKKIQNLGAGEIIINSIDLDGTMKGYDFNLIKKLKKVIHIPLTVLGGAGSFDDISKLIHENGIIGAGAESLFVFKGKYRAVLINYPSTDDKLKILKQANFNIDNC